MTRASTRRRWAHSKALEIELKVLGPEHPDVAASYNNLGTVYTEQGKQEEALGAHSKALEIRLKVFGDVHPKVARTKHNMGLVLKATGN